MECASFWRGSDEGVQVCLLFTSPTGCLEMDRARRVPATTFSSSTPSHSRVPIRFHVSLLISLSCLRLLPHSHPPPFLSFLLLLLLVRRRAIPPPPPPPPPPLSRPLPPPASLPFHRLNLSALAPRRARRRVLVSPASPFALIPPPVSVSSLVRALTSLPLSTSQAVRTLAATSTLRGHRLYPGVVDGRAPCASIAATTNFRDELSGSVSCIGLCRRVAPSSF